MPNTTRADVLRQLDLLRGGLRIAMTCIRKMKHNQKVDADAVLRRLALIRAEAKEVRDDATDRELSVLLASMESANSNAANRQFQQQRCGKMCVRTQTAWSRHQHRSTMQKQPNAQPRFWFGSQHTRLSASSGLSPAF